MPGFLYFIIAYVMWGLLPIYWKQLDSLDSLYILGIRIILSMVFSLVVLLIKGQRESIGKIYRNKKLLKKLVIAGACDNINAALYILAVNSGHILEASLAYYMNPIFTILISYIFYKEPIAKIQWLAIGLAITGVLIAVFAYGQPPVYALAISIWFAIYGGIKKNVQLDPAPAVFFESLGVTPFALIYLIYYVTTHGSQLASMPLSTMGFLSLSGVAAAYPLMIYGKGMNRSSLSMAGILMYLNPTLQLLVGVFLYHEPFTKVNAITFGFVWVAVALFTGYNYAMREKKLAREGVQR